MLGNCVENNYKTNTEFWSFFYKKICIIILQQFIIPKIIWLLIRVAQVTNSNTLYNTILFDVFLKALLQHILSLTESGTPQQHSASKQSTHLIWFLPQKPQTKKSYLNQGRKSIIYMLHITQQK